MNLNPITFRMECTATAEEVRANIFATLKRGYEGLTEYLNGTNREVSIVGAAPSLGDTYREIRGHVLAVNSALGYLIDRGVIPHMAMMWDAHPLVVEFAVPHPDVIYLVNARCHPYVFERLKGCRIVVWFADGDHDIRKWLRERGINEPLIKGGSAGITRSMFIAFALGYRELHIHGADSSYSGSKSHINGSVVREDEMQVWLDAEGKGPEFRTTPWLAIQVREHAKIVPLFAAMGAKIDVHGSGLLPHVHQNLGRFA